MKSNTFRLENILEEVDVPVEKSTLEAQFELKKG
jgi:hypothetical protein